MQSALTGRTFAPDGHEQIALAAPYVQRQGGVSVQVPEEFVELLSGFHFSGLAFAGHGRDDVARAHVCAAIVAYLFDDHAPSELQVALLLRGKIDARETEAIGWLLRRLSAALAAACDTILGQFTDGDGDLPGRALAQQLDGGLDPGLGAADDARQLVRARYRLAVELENDVARLHPRLLGGAALLDGIDEGSNGPGQAERLSEFLRDFLDHDADPPAGHAPELAQLALPLHRDVDRDGE